MVLPTYNTEGWKRVKQAGFTLVELMVVVVIVAILAGIAIPAYNSSVEKSRRADGKGALLDLAARQEKFFFSNNRYACAVSDLNYGATSPEGYYTITDPIPSCSNTAFVLTAVPTGAQAGDTVCGSFQLNQAGTKTITGTGSAQDCW